MKAEAPVERAGWLGAAQSWLTRINWAACLFALFLSIMLMFVTVYEVVKRYVFNDPTVWSLEISQYLMLTALFAAASYTLEVGGHIKVDFLLEQLGPRGQRRLNLVSSVAAIIFFALLLRETGRLAWGALVFGGGRSTLLSIPLFPIYIFAPIGSFLILVQGILQFLRLLKQ
jgi:C4-dicarboxylate transporter, DctQ subunit